MAKCEIEPEDTKRVTWDPAGDGEPIVFVYRPVGVYELLCIRKQLMAPGPPTAEGLSESTVNLWVDLMVSQVTDWSGVEMSGAPAACTPENRRRLFSRNVGAYAAMLRAFNGIPEDPARPNVSGDGSGSSSPIPSSSVESTTSMETSAQIPVTDPAAVATAATGSTG